MKTKGNRNTIEDKRLQVAIHDYLQAAKHATPFQVRCAMESLGYPVDGEAGICYERNHNIVFIQGISPELAKSITGLIDEKLIQLEVVSPILHYVDRTVPEYPPLTTRQINYLIEHWGDAAWVTEPRWVPVVLMPASINMADLARVPITPKMLQATLNSSDAAGHGWREQFGNLISSAAGEPDPVNGVGRGGE